MAALFRASLVLLLIAGAVLLASAQSPAPAPSVDCTSYLLNMSDCLSYVEAESNITAPDPACCPELAGMVQAKPLCLCQLLNSAGSFGIEISVTKALDLPSACGVRVPPVSGFCSAAGFPIEALTPTEAPSPATGDGSPTTTGSSDNGASDVALSQLLHVLGSAIATLSAFFWF